MRMLSVMLILGLSMPAIVGAQDLDSLERVRLEAEKGNIDAQLEMGILYEFGYNMQQNNVNALAWYLRAAQQGSALAAKRSDDLKSRMRPVEVEAAEIFSQELAAKKIEPMQTVPEATPPNVTDSPPATPIDEPPPITLDAEQPPSTPVEEPSQITPMEEQPSVEPMEEQPPATNP